MLSRLFRRKTFMTNIIKYTIINYHFRCILLPEYDNDNFIYFSFCNRDQPIFPWRQEKQSTLVA